MVSIKDVAARCHVSISTVSKSLNGYGDVGEETRKRVQEIAQEMGYHPNAQARALKTHRSFNLGLLFVEGGGTSFAYAFYGHFIDGFKSHAEQEGYDITFINHNIGKRKATYLEHCRYRGIDGLCIANALEDNEEFEELFNSDLPIVLMDSPRDGVPTVQSSNYYGMKQLTEYCIGMGHRRIAYIHGQHYWDVTQERIDGFMDAMKEHGLSVPEQWLVKSEYHNEAMAKEKTAELLRLPQRPSCILLPDDYSALEARNAILDFGLRMPEDISIAGYNGLRFTRYIVPVMTTVRQSAMDIGERAAQLLIRYVQGDLSVKNVRDVMPTQLQEGESIYDLRPKAGKK